MKQSHEKLWDVLYVILGGLLTMSSTFLVQSVGVRNEHNRVMRDKIEQIYTLTLDAETWIKKDVEFLVWASYDQAYLDKRYESPCYKVAALIKLVFDYGKLVILANELERNIKAYESSLISYMAKIEPNNYQYSPEVYKTTIQPAITAISTSVLLIQEELQVTMKDYL